MSERKTVRVRIAVVVDESGDWSAAGSGGLDWATDDPTSVDEAHEAGVAPDGAVRFVEADVPLPVPAVVVEGEVSCG